MRTAIFVDLGQIPGLLTLKDEVEVRTIHSPDTESALTTIRETSPSVVVASAALEEGAPGAFLEAVRGAVPGFQGAVIVANISAPPQTLTVYEWNPAERDYVSRAALPKDLNLEVGRFCRRGAGIWTDSEELRAIGFADNVEHKGASIHIQTEILAREKIRIKTTVLEGGAVRAKFTEPFQPEGDDAVAETREAARLQHAQVLEGLVAGEYDHG
jgi:hypothetical protein